MIFIVVMLCYHNTIEVKNISSITSFLVARGWLIYLPGVIVHSTLCMFNCLCTVHAYSVCVCTHTWEYIKKDLVMCDMSTRVYLYLTSRVVTGMISDMV